MDVKHVQVLVLLDVLGAFDQLAVLVINGQFLGMQYFLDPIWLIFFGVRINIVIIEIEIDNQATLVHDFISAETRKVLIDVELTCLDLCVLGYVILFSELSN